MVKAWVQQAKDQPGGWTELGPEAFPDEDVTVEVINSAVNFKDALALTGRSPIFRKFPMVPGVDMAGRVTADRSGTFKPGTLVVATGFGLGEVHWGAYAGIAKMKPEWLTEIPAGLDAAAAATLGTAGVTAAMCVNALEAYGIRPDAGQVVVTGPAGGVGGFALMLLAKAGYDAVAATGRPEEEAYLKGLGAKEIINRSELEGEPRPLGKERWAAGIDVAGGKILANILPSIKYGGAVAACGLAQSMSLPTSVAPFILRGVALLGVDSVMAPAASRQKAWQRLARDLTPASLGSITVKRGFDEADGIAKDLLDQKIRGRVLLEWR